jgi:hypothetical protein
MSLEQYPDFVRQPIAQLTQRMGISTAEVLTMFERELEKAKIMSLENFPNATPQEQLDIRMRFAIGVVWRDNINLPPLISAQLIFVGHDGLQSSGAGKPYSNMYFITNEPGTGTKLIRMSAKGGYAEAYRSLGLFTRYDAQVGRYNTGDTLLFDSRARLSNPTPVPLSIRRMNELLSIPTITVEQAKDTPSRTQSSGFMIDTDWRCIFGYFSGEPRVFATKKNKDIRRAVFNITDTSVKESPHVDAQGNIVTPGLTAWAAPEHLVYDERSYCAFYGPIRVIRDVEKDIVAASMNTFLVRPILTTDKGVTEV